jgi:hypothetical protein
MGSQVLYQIYQIMKILNLLTEDNFDISMGATSHLTKFRSNDPSIGYNRWPKIYNESFIDKNAIKPSSIGLTMLWELFFQIYLY